MRWNSPAAAMAAILFVALPGAKAAAAAELATVTVGEESSMTERMLDGTVEAVHQATIAAQTAGRVAAINVDVNDYVEVELTGTVQVESLPTTNLALGIGFIFREHGAAFSSATIAMQDGYQQFEYSHVLGFHLKARGYLSTALAGITRGAVLYPVLMNYGIAGATKYYLLGDLSATAKVWRAN